MYCISYTRYCITNNSGPGVVTVFSCSTLLRLKFILLIGVRVPTTVGTLAFVSGMNYRPWKFKPLVFVYSGYYGVCEELEFQAQLS